MTPWIVCSLGYARAGLIRRPHCLMQLPGKCPGMFNEACVGAQTLLHKSCFAAFTIFARCALRSR
jgi:hypothetical protein